MIDNLSTTQPTAPVELWVCGRTKKCGWKGLQTDLVYVPDLKCSRQDLNPKVGTCPKCGRRDFYVRKVVPL